MAIKKWMIKAAVQKTISLLPYRNQINLWFQKNITKGVQLDREHLHWKLTHARDHLTYWQKYSRQSAPNCLELGTGWYPIVPIMLYLHGARKIQTIDLNAHLNQETLEISLRKLIAEKESGRLDLQFPDIQADRWAQLQQLAAHTGTLSLKEALAELKIEAVVGDARQLPVADQFFDLICSNNTFEHIFPDVLAGILQEFKRVLKRDGVMSHFIDLSDHFAHFDPSINIYNFLRFSEKQWSLIDNDIQPQNRWRWPQYQELYRKLQIPLREESVRKGDIQLLREVPVHMEWDRFTAEELAISHGYLVT
jgi:SAM-dependent methyltransferase